MILTTKEPPILFGSQLLKPSWGETENHLEFRWKKTILKKMLQESNEKIYFKIFPVSSHLHDLCKHYKTWSFNTIETMLVVGMCFLVQWRKGNVIKAVLEHSSLNQCLIQYQLHVHVTQILELRAEYPATLYHYCFRWSAFFEERSRTQ